jgi:hypothetical protein
MVSEGDREASVTRSRLARLIPLLFLIGRFSSGVLPVAAQYGPPDERFGAVEAFWDPTAAAEAGVAWERILFYWSELQPEGPDDWNGYHVPDEWLGLADQQGRQVMGLLKHTPAWATDGPPGCGVPRGLDLPVDDPDNLWARFVRRTVGMYEGRIGHWVIWNEPDIQSETYGNEWCGSMEAYYRLLKVAYLAAHEVNPEVTIHLAGLTYWHDRQYLERFLAHVTEDPAAADHGQYFDVVTVHIYFQTDSVPFIINETRAVLRKYGLQKPIWVNETNASPDSDPNWPLTRPRWRVSLEEQAGFLLQSFALALSAGAERVAVYKLKDVGLPPGGEPFGLIRPDGSRRPAFTAYKLMTTHYAGTTSASEERHRLYDLVTLSRGDVTTRVLWARTGSEVEVSLPALASGALLVDQAGAEQQIEAEDGGYTLVLPGARCADEHAGCIIGGTTYLLVEETVLPTATSTPAPTVTAEVTATATVSTTVGTAPDVPATVVVPTPSPSGTPTRSKTPSSTPSATVTPSDTPTRTPTVTRSATSTPTPTPTLGALGSSTPGPSATTTPRGLTPTPSPAVRMSTRLSTQWVVVAVVSLVASAAVAGMWFNKRTSG